MWDFSIGQAMALMAKTMPFIVLRIAVYAGVTAAFIVATGLGAGIGWGIGALGDADFQGGATVWGAIIGFGVVAGALFFAREYILYMVKAGHIAVLVRLIDGGDVPAGQGQIAYATDVVKARFGEANVLFGVDLLIKGVLGAILGLVQGIATLLPIPGVHNILGILRAFLRLSVGLVDEVILGHAIHTNATNPWASAQKALVLYAQNYKVMLRNAAWLTLFTYGLALLVFLVALSPAAAIVWLMPGGLSAAGFVFALVFAWAVKAALIEPFAIACLMQVYFRTTDGQTPDPEWERRIAGVSGKFGELQQKAAQWVGGQGANGGLGTTK